MGRSKFIPNHWFRADETVRRYLGADEARTLLNASGHTGDAPERARALALAIRERTS